MIAMLKERVRSLLRRLGRVAIGDEIHEAVMCSPALKVAQKHLFMQYQTMVKQSVPLPSIFDTGFRVFSQFDEDGILLFLFAVLGTKSKTFVDIGAADGVNSNCANLAINFGWHGLFIDANEASIAHGKEFYRRHPDTSFYPPVFVHAMVTRENINQVIRGAGFEGEIDLLSIDIDGNDYWIWDALECIQARVVIIETSIQFGLRNIVVPYDPEYVYPGRHPDYFGASAVAMTNLAHRKGYRLVGANRFGFNTIYVRKEEGVDLIPTVSVEAIMQHPRTQEQLKLFDAIKDWPYVEG